MIHIHVIVCNDCYLMINRYVNTSDIQISMTKMFVEGKHSTKLSLIVHSYIV